MPDQAVYEPDSPRGSPISAEPFAPGHYHDILNGKLRRDAAGDPDDIAAPLRDGAVATTIMYTPPARRADSAPRPVACAGVIPAGEGRARAWLIVAEGLLDKTMEGVSAALAIFFGQQPVRRIEMPVPLRALRTIRWAREAGFKIEVPRLDDFAGEAYALYTFKPGIPDALELADTEIAKAMAEGDRDLAVRLASSKGQLLKTLATMRRAVPVAGPL